MSISDSMMTPQPHLGADPIALCVLRLARQGRKLRGVGQTEEKTNEDANYRTSWRRPKQVPAPNSKPRSIISLDQARAAMREHIDVQLNDERGLLIVTGPPGIGKTTLATQVAARIARDTGAQIAWFGTRHNQFDVVPRSPGWLHVEGRHDDNCEMANIAAIVGSKGWPVSDLLCDGRCQVGRRRCSYWRQWQGEADRFMPAQHLIAAALWDRPDLLLVFDELDIHHFVPEPVHLDLNAIGAYIALQPELRDVLNPLMNFVAGNGQEYLADAPLYEALDQILPGWPRLAQIAPGDSSDDLDAWANDLPDAYTGECLSGLYRELARYRNGEQFVSRVAVYGGRIIHHPHPRLPSALFNHPAVLLNSTADVDALRHVLQRGGYPVEVYSPNVALHPRTEVHYVLDANHSKSAVSRNNNGYRDRWIQRVEDAIADSSQALVVATIEGEEMLREELDHLVNSGRVVLAHYGAVSGLNAYETCDTVVLAQPFNPSPTAVAGLYRQVYGGRPGEPLDVSTCYRTVKLPWSDGDGTTWQVSVSTMRDQRLAPIYEHWRWSEMYQAAHRVRPILRGRRIVITCAIPLSGLEPTSVSYAGRRTDTLDALCVAARRLIREKGHFTRSDLAITVAVSESTVRRYWDDLLQAEQLRIVEIAVPAPRYPGGRKAEAATT
jgi:hypothetical protein